MDQFYVLVQDVHTPMEIYFNSEDIVLIIMTASPIRYRNTVSTTLHCL